jgi:hypothetical protein
MSLCRIARSLCTIAFAACAAIAAHAENPYLHDDYVRFIEWFPGEYDNHEQVWQEEGEKSAQPHEHIHHIFTPVKIAALGEQVYFVQQTLNDDPENIYRLRAYTLQEDADRSALVMTIYRFKDEAVAKDAYRTPEKLAVLTLDDFTTIPGCEVYWQWHEPHFKGTMVQDACSFVSERSGKRIIVNDDLRLSKDELWIRDVAVDEEGKPVFGDAKRSHHINRKVRYYDGWAAMKRGGKKAEADSKDWVGVRGLRLHNEGRTIKLVSDSGEALGYSVQLARLTYQNTTTPILKLALIDDATGKTLSYAWAEPDGKRLGINLGWLQVGFTLREGNIHIGW